MAACCARRGVEPGDRVGIMLPNVPYFPVVYYGVLRAGGVVVPMNVLLKGREVAYYLEDSGAKLLFAWHGFAEAARAGRGGGRRRVRARQARRVRAAAGRRAEAVTEIADRGGRRHRGDPLHLGHHRQAKGAELTHANLRRNSDGGGEHLGEVSEEDVVLGALPLFHSFGQTCGMNATIAPGGC